MSQLLPEILQNPLISVGVGIASLLLGWHRFRHGALRLSKQRSQRLFDLTRNGKWRKADPIALQIAVSDAFRQTVDDRWIKLALLRHKPWNLLADCKLATGMLALRTDGLGFTDIKPGRNRSFRIWSVIIFLFAPFSWMTLWLCLFVPAEPPTEWLIGLFIFSLIITPFVGWLSACLEAAHRLVRDLDDRHPLVKTATEDKKLSRERELFSGSISSRNRRKPLTPVENPAHK